MRCKMKPNSINIHEREIKLLDMFWAIVLEWRKITIITLICAACFSIYCYFSAYKLAEDTQGEEDKSIVLTE